MGRGTAKKKEKKDLNELKQELEIDVHRVSVDELLKRFNTNVERGLTDDQAKKNFAEYGPNALTPPPQHQNGSNFVRICSLGLPACSGWEPFSASWPTVSRHPHMRSPQMITCTLELS
eukprot:TRINITY_DN120_c0_g1_i8.p1 TRINITY_DN120_c0_g1~~TRINITY_DN120_c0_g1_i8.p1  ORF type:complete len:118 (-),score=20.73 TRINITY_DN120_c0_g1_i8:120-473(-)